ncbi:MAG: hypothetical protein V1768_01185 [Patescibacteria group bacterium]|nr:hypothetical protein [Patescibacteria group bacterium]MBU1160552.1 hypothetical protein [Patescibacteria group bacterium]MBU1684451.1 hypothetical protein [Patescibacteria group bacterium]MBU1778577.1 hypothetical protein [Patescibacteria group bacterium]MBU1987557.1 hypothetical protein [Patescibacteria group bacterium]
MITQIQTARISALLPFTLVKEIKKTSVEKNITQSSIIKNALEFWFQKKLAKDADDLSKLNFNDLPSENDWTFLI